MIGLDIVDVPNKFMIGAGNASELKMSIDGYKGYIKSNDSIFQIGSQIDYLFNTNDPVPVNGQIISWEMSKFLNIPLISAISNLSAIQLNVRSCEMIILSKKINK